MKVRARSVLAVAVVALAGVAWWWFGRDRASEPPASVGAAPASSNAAPGAGLGGRVGRDPRRLDRASIAGTIRGPDGRPIAHARVCVDASSPELSDELTRDPRCADTSERGTYVIGELYVARYTIAAMARGFAPAAYQLTGDPGPTLVAVGAGEHKLGIDVVLASGGAELTGVVNDVSGGPIAHAHVRCTSGDWASGAAPLELPMIEAGNDGTFTMWVRAGAAAVTATADGYATGSDRGRAPGKVEILLTPESSLAGTVVDARTGQPVAGVRVEASPTGTGADASSSGEITTPASDLSDEHGAFHLTRMAPGRYAAVALGAHGYGRSPGTIEVGLGQHVTGAVIKLFPAQRVAGVVTIAGDPPLPCKLPSVSLHEPATGRTAPLTDDSAGGAMHADGVLAGTYDVVVQCEGALARVKYDPIKVGDHDVTGVVWQVDAGATIAGRVTTRSGAAVDGAEVIARSSGGDPRAPVAWATAHSAADGAFAMTGVRPGSNQLEVRSERGITARDGWQVEVAAGATAHRDLVLDDGGTIKGAVVDAAGAPVGGVRVLARSAAADGWDGRDVRTADDGRFELANVTAGDYRVVAQRNWGEPLRTPGTTDDAPQGQPVTVAAGATATVHLVVEAQTAEIRGVVIDAAGAPVGDAFVSAARESDRAGSQHSAASQTRWTGELRPVLSAVDGTFAITHLSPGTYSVRADRKGGGEAITEHVATGAVATLQIKQSASIDGTARRAGGEPDELAVTITEPSTGFSRHETFFRTAGHYALGDLPAGHFTLTFACDGSQQQLELELGDGEARTGVDLTLPPVLVVTGRVVDAATHAPVAGVTMVASPGPTFDSAAFDFSGAGDQANVSDAAGRFTLAHAPRGKVTLLGLPAGYDTSDYQYLITVRSFDSDASSLELGDLAISKRRLKRGDKVGELGVHFADEPPGTPIDQIKLTVAWIDPAGPAAASGLVVGDVVTAIDGRPASGADIGGAWMAMQAPPGTAIQLGLARGATVTVVLAQP